MSEQLISREIFAPFRLESHLEVPADSPNFWGELFRNKEFRSALSRCSQITQMSGNEAGFLVSWVPDNGKLALHGNMGETDSIKIGPGPDPTRLDVFTLHFHQDGSLPSYQDFRFAWGVQTALAERRDGRKAFPLNGVGAALDDGSIVIFLFQESAGWRTWKSVALWSYLMEDGFKKIRRRAESTDLFSQELKKWFGFKIEIININKTGSPSRSVLKKLKTFTPPFPSLEGANND